MNGGVFTDCCATYRKRCPGGTVENQKTIPTFLKAQLRLGLPDPAHSSNKPQKLQLWPDERTGWASSLTNRREKSIKVFYHGWRGVHWVRDLSERYLKEGCSVSTISTTYPLDRSTTLHI